MDKGKMKFREGEPFTQVTQQVRGRHGTNIIILWKK